jgi:hypothetical protein
LTAPLAMFPHWPRVAAVIKSHYEFECCSGV